MSFVLMFTNIPSAAESVAKARMSKVLGTAAIFIFVQLDTIWSRLEGKKKEVHLK